MIILQLFDMLSHYAMTYFGHFNSTLVKGFCNVGISKHHQIFGALSESQSLLIFHVGNAIVQDTKSGNPKH